MTALAFVVICACVLFATRGFAWGAQGDVLRLDLELDAHRGVCAQGVATRGLARRRARGTGARAGGRETAGRGLMGMGVHM